MASCDPNAFKNLAAIPDIDDADKETLKEILLQEMSRGGGKIKKRKSRLSKKRKTKHRKTRRLQKGGLGVCDYVECMTLLASIIFIGYGIARCNYSGSYSSIILYALNGFSGGLSIIFGLNASKKYREAPAEEKQNVAHAGQFDWIGKLNMIHMYAGKIVGYINKLKNKGINCKTVIPDPLYEFLKILCEVKNGKLEEAEAKLAVKNLLEPIQNSQNIITMEGNSIIIQNMQPNQVVKINVELLQQFVSTPEPTTSAQNLQASSSTPAPTMGAQKLQRMPSAASVVSEDEGDSDRDTESDTVVGMYLKSA